MDPISSLSQIMQQLRQRLAQRQGADRPERARPHGEATRIRGGRVAKASSADVQRRIGERLGRLDPDERTTEKGAQIFVDAVLAWEFGDAVLGDPEFSVLAREVREALTEDPEVWRNLQRMLAEL